MAFENLKNVHYTQAQKTATLAALTSLETELSANMSNLSPEERRRYGSINEQNKLFVNKALDYYNSQPTLSSSDVDWAEFHNDHSSREFIEGVMARLQELLTGLNNNKILHDSDNYQAALTDYGYSQYKAGTKAPGFENKANELGQFFRRNAPTPPAESEL